MAERHGVSTAQVALAWMLAQEGVSCAIVGARRIGQLEDNLQALALQLRPEDLAELDAGTALPRAYPGWVQAMSNHHREPFLEA